MKTLKQVVAGMVVVVDGLATAGIVMTGISLMCVCAMADHTAFVRTAGIVSVAGATFSLLFMEHEIVKFARSLLN